MTSSRSALLSAAVEVFKERGYEAATVADIAQRAGVTTGALYAHFHGKLDLLLQSLGLETVEEFARDALAASGAGTGGGPGAGSRARLTASVMAANLARRPTPEAVLLLDVVVAARRDPRLAATLRRLLADKVEEFSRATRRATAAGGPRPVLVSEDLARMLTALAFGSMVLAAMDEDPPSPTAFSVVVDALMAGGAGGGADPLASVAQAASSARRGRAALEAAVVEARAAGHSLRQIAEAAGVSHERVRRLLEDAAVGTATG